MWAYYAIPLSSVCPSVCPFHFATPPKPFGNVDETWYKERSHYVDMHIVREALSSYFSSITAPGLSYFFEKYFVFATPPKFFGGF
jgi:hypothetical protein